MGASTISLHLEDCFQGMRSMEAGSVDVVVTSPPYNIGVKYGVYNDHISRHDYLNWIEKWSEEVLRVLAPQGSVFFNIGGTPSDPWGPLETAQRLGKRFQLQNTIHWIKSIAIERSGNGDNHGLARRCERRPYQADQQPPLSLRRTRVCISFYQGRKRAFGSFGHRCALQAQIEHHTLEVGRIGSTLSREHVVHSLQDDCLT